MLPKLPALVSRLRTLVVVQNGGQWLVPTGGLDHPL